MELGARNRSKSHAVLIPSYNSGAMLARTVESAALEWLPLCVVVDGSTDGSERALAPVVAASGGAIRVIRLAENSGKGGAVLAGLRALAAEGFTHALVMDADGQHAAEGIGPFMRRSAARPDAMVLGVPVFGPDAPSERVCGRLVGNFFANLETLWGGVRDSLFGFRVYPVSPALEIMESIRTARRFDFDTEIAVRLYWAGVPPVNIPAAVRYPAHASGGVTHFDYVRDNLLLVGTHVRLVAGMLRRLPQLASMRVARTREQKS